MATPEQLEELQQHALLEEQAAAAEKRLPDSKHLNALGGAIVGGLRPVVCMTSDAYHMSYDPDEGYVTRSAAQLDGVTGRFGGFAIQPFGSEDDPENIEYRVNYLIHDTRSTNTGYFCPVKSSTLIDAVDKISEEQEFIKMQEILGKDPIDMYALDALFRNITDVRKVGHFLAFMQSVVMPYDVYERVYVDGTMRSQLFEDGSKVDTPFFSETFLPILPNDRFVVGDFTNGGPSREIAIKRGYNPCIYIPLSFIKGFDMVLNQS